MGKRHLYRLNDIPLYQSDFAPQRFGMYTKPSSWTDSASASSLGALLKNTSLVFNKPVTVSDGTVTSDISCILNLSRITATTTFEFGVQESGGNHYVKASFLCSSTTNFTISVASRLSGASEAKSAGTQLYSGPHPLSYFQNKNLKVRISQTGATVTAYLYDVDGTTVLGSATQTVATPTYPFTYSQCYIQVSNEARESDGSTYSTDLTHTGYIEYDSTNRCIAFEAAYGIYNSGTAHTIGTMDDITLSTNLWDGWSKTNATILETVDQFGNPISAVVKFTTTAGNIVQTFNQNTLRELKLSYYMSDVNCTLDIKVDGASVWKMSGPTAWEDCPPIKIPLGSRVISINYSGVTGATAMVSNVRVGQYSEIDCLFQNSKPYVQKVNSDDQSLVGGYSTFQQASKGYAQSEFNLYMTEPQDYILFMGQLDHIHAVLDEIGLHYRGILSVESVEQVGDATAFYPNCTHRAPYMAGVGW